MKAFKGCTNKECSAYRKIRYKDADNYCKRCGNELFYVCGDCWMEMSSSANQFCTACETKKEQKREQMLAKGRDGAKFALGAVGTAASIVATLGKDSDKLIHGAKKLGKAGAAVAKVVKKK